MSVHPGRYCWIWLPACEPQRKLAMGHDIEARDTGLEPNRLYQGDCVENLDKVEAGSVDLVFADPPFNIGYDYDVYDDQADAERYLDWTRKWGRAVQRALKPTGTFWLAIGDEYAAELKLVFQKELGF